MPRAVKLRDLVVLGLLREHPRYGYEIKIIIDNVMSHVIDVSSGSLYYGLKKLQERGFVEEDAVEKIGRRPERSVYKITDEGFEYFDRELPRVVFPRARPYFPLDLALYFFPFMDTGEQARRLKMRSEYLTLALDYLRKSIDNLEGVAPLNQIFIMTHRIRYITMEQNFIHEVLNNLVKDSAYSLTDGDWVEVRKEFEDLKQHLRLETVIPDVHAAGGL